MLRDYRNPAATQRFAALAADPALLPFSFQYDGVLYEGFSAEYFTLLDKTSATSNGKESVTFRFRFAKALIVTLLLTHYPSHSVTEWTVWFENTSNVNSGLLSDLTTSLTFEGAHPELKGILGDHVNQYRPYCIDLADQAVSFSSDSGRATHINFPYFNLEYGTGGAMLAIGWAGTWRAAFSAVKDRTVCRLSAVNNLCTCLKPGEKIRSALFTVAPYTCRSEAYAANYWRDWFIRCSLPRANAAGDPITPFSTSCFADDTGLPNSDGSISERYHTWKPTFEKMLAVGVHPDFRWFDAGWYVRPDGRSEETDWWGSIGAWELDPVKWPGDSFRESTDYARAHGVKTLVWFEPERVTDPENLVKNYGYRMEWAIRVPGERTISNNIGDPECLDWTVKRVTDMLRKNRVELYREDNNCNAIKLWLHMDRLEGQDRQGITECKFIAAHYELWDRIIECTLSLGGCGFVDSCASGGGRNDLESMRRGVPLLRSDSDRTTTSLRLSMSWGFNKWIPFCGSSTKETKGELDVAPESDPYVWRASYLPALSISTQYVHRENQDFSDILFGVNEWETIKPYLLKEFYTLTPWHSEQDRGSFTAFAYFDPERETGVLLAFRQESCPLAELTVSLPFAEGKAFRFTDADTGAVKAADKRLTLHFDSPRQAKLLTFGRV